MAEEALYRASFEDVRVAARTWIEVDLDAVAANYATARALAGPDAGVICVLKGDAYGHGAVPVARRLAEAGAEHFAVSCVREGLELRAAGIGGSILVMGLAEDALLPRAVAAGLALTVDTVEGAQRAAQAALAANTTVVLHAKVDAGFHRLGFDARDAETPGRIVAVAVLPGARLEGLYAHLSLRTTEDDAAQAARLHAVHAALRELGCAPSLHLLDSIGLVRYPQWRHQGVRVGALLLGARPSRSDHLPFACLPTLRFCSTVTRVHWAERGEYVGYAEERPLQRRTCVATLPVGYADGYPRAMSGVASVSVRGQRAPVLGLVCMDQMMIDVTDVPGIEPGDVADLLGGDISLMEYATWAGSNRNECMARLTRRPPRVYRSGGEVVAVRDALLDE